MDIKLSSVEDSSADSPPKGYSTEAWNPPKNWVSPERIALARISAQPRIGVLCSLAWGGSLPLPYGSTLACLGLRSFSRSGNEMKTLLKLTLPQSDSPKS